jgi:hypothetical protein
MLTNNRKYVLSGFFSIASVCLLYNMFLVDANYYEQIPREIKHLARLATIVLVYCIGLYSFKKYNVKWVTDLWNMIYLAIVPLLILIGFADLVWGPVPVPLRSISKTLHDCLISPIVFAAILIVKKTAGKLRAGF